MTVEFKVVRQFINDRNQCVIHDTEVPNWEARMATVLIEKWGTVAGVPDGEDSAGRAKLGLMKPEDVIDRAVTMAELAVKTFREKGWVFNMPTLAEIDATDVKEK